MHLAPQRIGLQLTMSQGMHDKLQHARALLSHQVPSGDFVQVLERALDVLIEKLERRKFAATEKPRPQAKTASRARGADTRNRGVPKHARLRQEHALHPGVGQTPRP